MKFLFIDIKR